jgi:hypothetical protein
MNIQVIGAVVLMLGVLLFVDRFYARVCFWIRMRLALKLALIITPRPARSVLRFHLNDYWLDVLKTMKEAEVELKRRAVK